MKTLIGVAQFFIAVVFSLFMGFLEILLLPIDRRRGRLFHALARFWARTVLAICRVRVGITGVDNLDRSRSYVYVSNHASMFDIPAILAAVPDQIRIVYKKELEVIPFFGWGLKWGHYVGIDRGRSSKAMKSIEEAIGKIRNGQSLLLYAEGTRTLDGKLQPFKRGAFNIAVRAGVPVVPLTVNGSFRIMPKRSIIIRPGDVELVLAKPILIPESSGRDAERQLMEHVHAAIAANYIDQSSEEQTPCP
ncbi:MAG: 1-acyl-sn-glycerol-3-phosphate acyltransferase [Bacteroidetes bacterium]|jgi:1-acyl-sn-glycerol-3-phosphate acyltransferase|nr:1-acyl-sn-glycerol-3-phosphate acyltransferase [Bacteroidota bacterium]